MTWIGERVRDRNLIEVYSRVEGLVEWSDWLPFPACLPDVPREPGVYLFREPGSLVIRYAGRAGDRASSGRPEGLYGQLKGVPKRQGGGQWFR